MTFRLGVEHVRPLFEAKKTTVDIHVFLQAVQLTLTSLSLSPLQGGLLALFGHFGGSFGNAGHPSRVIVDYGRVGEVVR